MIILLIVNGVLVLHNAYKADMPEEENNDLLKEIPKALRTRDTTWEPFEILSEPVKGFNFNKKSSHSPKITAEDDKIYVVWSDVNDTDGAGTDQDIFFRYFNGNFWSEIQVISEPVTGMDINKGDCGFPDIAVENGKIYVSWNDNSSLFGSGPDWDICYRTNLSGSGWEPIQVISEPNVGVYGNNNTGDSYRSSIAVENGKVFITWTDENNTNGCEGGYWYEEIFHRCNLTGTSWEDTQVISEPVFGQNISHGWSDFPDLAVENGSIYVVWMDENDTNNADGDLDIFFRCNITGNGWNVTEVISEPVLGQGVTWAGSWEPKIAVENGNIYVIWEDYNIYSGAGADLDIFYRYTPANTSNPANTSWQDIQVISEPVAKKDYNTGEGWFKGIAVENGIVFVVWDDNNNTDGSNPKGGILGLSDTDIRFRCNHSALGWGIIQTLSEPIFGTDINIRQSDHSDIAVSGSKIHVVWQDYNETNGADDDCDIFYRRVPPIALRLPEVKPSTGNSSTFFNFSISYVNNFNIKPTEVYVNISGIDYQMTELNPNDQNYLNGKKYYLNITHLGVGQHRYHFWASDGKNISKLSVSNKVIVYNTPPYIKTADNLTVAEDNYYDVQYECDDIDVKNVNQSIFWNFSTDAAWLMFNSTSAILNGTPTNDDVGDFWVNITVNDTIANDTTNFTLIVVEVNDNPIITTDDVEITYEDEFYEVDYNASDIDSQLPSQLWTLETNASSWLKINLNTGILSGTPANEHVGSYWVNVSVDDDEGGLGFTNFSLNVINVNDRPVITTLDSTTAIIGELYEVDYDAMDVDSPESNLEWHLDTNASSWLILDSETGILSGTPSIIDLGWYDVNISVSDGDGGTTWHKFMLIVERPNAPPLIRTKDNLTAFVDISYQTDYEATDDRTPVNQLIWTFTTNASWLNFHESTAIIYGTPTVNDIGTYWVNISVVDREDALSFHNFTLTVTKQITIGNNPPVLSNPNMDPLEGDTHTEFIFSVHYYDLDNERPMSIHIVIDGRILNMTLKPREDPTNGTYEYRTKLSAGRHTCYFTATDGKDIVILEKFTTSSIKDASKGSMFEFFWNSLIWVIIVLIIVLLIAAFVIQAKRKKKPLEKYKEERVSLAPSPLVSKPPEKSPVSAPPTTPTSGPSVSTTPTVSAPSPVTPHPMVSIPTEIKLVGRERELQDLLVYLENAEDDRGGTVFITGEAGIGKTRLLNEVKQIALSKDFQILSGNCTIESMTPYIPYLEALRSGDLDYLFAEETPRVEAVYLITYDGLLIKESVRKETKLDPDVFSSMLFTVSNFINESLSMLLGSDKEGTLNTLGYENYRILVESGKSANLVVIITGKETEFLINDMRELFKNVDERFGNVLQTWDGDENKVEGIENILVTLITSGKYDGIYYETEDPKARRDLLFKNISLGLSRSTNTAPVFLCIEDLQWADPSSLALMQYISRNTRNSGILTMGTFRPEEITGMEGRSHPLTETLQMMDREDLYGKILLQRLPEDSINEFISSQLGKNEFSDEFKNRIYRETDGNPLFIIQLIKFLVEEEVVVKDDDTWKLVRELEEINIPTKIYNVIARRLDKLETGDRKVLDYASVIGPTFTSNILSHSLGVERIPLLEKLRSLEKTHKLIYTFDGNFKFDHEKIKEVLYNEIPPELRMEYHSIIANTIETLHKDTLSAFVGDLAFHYYQCRDKSKALQYLANAAAEAKKHYSNEEAIRFYTQALEFEEEPQKRTAILESLGDIYYLIRNFDLSIDSYNSALVLTEGRKKAEMMAKIGGILERKGEYDNSLEICTGALDLVKGTWTSEEALALQNIGNVHLSKKDYDIALEQYEQSLQIREKIGDNLGIGACLNNIALVHYGKEEYDSALEYLEKSLGIAKKLDDQESMASTLNNIGAIYQMKGDLAKAKIFYDKSRSIRAKIAAYIEVPSTPAPPGTTQIIRGGFRTP